LVDVLVDPRCEGTYAFARATSLSPDGMFVRTSDPAAIGTALRLRIPDEDGELELEGVVVWCNPGGLGAADPGMGVRLVGASARDRARLAERIGRVAYLAPGATR
jgi:uncharacterized protein (TIGR02266 family)